MIRQWLINFVLFCRQEAKVEELESNVESINYEYDRTKQQKEELMKHYEQVSLLNFVFRKLES